MKPGTCALYVLVVLFAIGSCGFVVSPAQAQGTASQSADPALLKWRQFGQSKANRAKAAAANVTAAEQEQARMLFAAGFDLAQRQNYDAAKLAFQRGLAIDPANAPAEYYLAEVFAQGNDGQAAIQHYAVAMALAPTSPEGIEAEAALTKAITTQHATQQAAQQAAAAEERRRQQAADEYRRQDARKHLVCAIVNTSHDSEHPGTTHTSSYTAYVNVLDQDRIRVRTVKQDQTTGADQTTKSGDRSPDEPGLSYAVAVSDGTIKLEYRGDTQSDDRFSSGFVIDRTSGSYREHTTMRSAPLDGSDHPFWLKIEGTGSCQEAHANSWRTAPTRPRACAADMRQAIRGICARIGPDAIASWTSATASALCYTSGTTGRPKRVLYSHCSTVIHALAANQPDVFGLRATDRVLLCTPMFHACGWSLPYLAPMVGAAQIYPGRHMDGASLHHLAETERATVSNAVRTDWLGVLQHMRDTGGRLATLRRIACGGSAVPEALFKAYAGYGTTIMHAWGITEMSALGVANLPNAATAGLSPDAAAKLQLKQGRGVWGVEMKITGADGSKLPWDGVAFGDVYARGPWICREYFKRGAEAAADADGWFATGDVGTIDPNGYLELVDRSKDVIKSGGEWISSIALENIAVSHPDVAEAATIAARHAKWQERPLLLVVPKPGRRVEPDSVLALFKGQVASWWIPDAVLVLDELPHSATCKLNKVALRERYGDHLLAGAAA